MESFQDIEHFVKTLSAAIKKKIPTKVSQLTNDAGYKTTDTTYKLSKSGSTVTLTGSDGSTTSVTDSNTTYSSLKNPYSLTVQNNGATVTSYDGSTAITVNVTNATASANGLMSAADKAKLDGISSSAGSNVVATESADGLMSAADKTKLDGIASSPSMLTNLGSTAAANVFQASPRPGVTGVLPIANGGTGVSSLEDLKSNLDIEFITRDNIETTLDTITDLQSKLAKITDKIYPVGSIYISVNSTSPADLFGGTWEQIKDRFLLAAGDTYAAGSTGGEAQHTLTVGEMPAHTHWYNDYFSGSTKMEYREYIETIKIPGTNIGDPDTEIGKSFPSRSTGGSQPHNNMPPYLTVYVWKRIA